MRLPHISHIAAFFTYFTKVRISHFFPNKLASSAAILIFVVILFESHDSLDLHIPCSPTDQVSAYSFCNNHHVLFCSLAVLDPRVGYTTMRTVKTELGVKGEDSFIKPVFFSQILLSILYSKLSSGNVNVK